VSWLIRDLTDTAKTGTVLTIDKTSQREGTPFGRFHTSFRFQDRDALSNAFSPLGFSIINS